MASGVTAKLLHVDLTNQQSGKPTATKLAELGIADVKA